MSNKKKLKNPPVAEVEAALDKLAKSKAALEATTEVYQEAVAEAVAAFEASGKTTGAVFLPVMNQFFHGTLVAPQSVNIDWEGLKDDIGEDVYREEVVEIIERPSEEKLMGAVQRGTIDLDTVEANSTLVEKKKYIRGTWKAADAKKNSNGDVKQQIKDDLSEASTRPRRIKTGVGAKVRKAAQQDRKAGGAA